MNEWKFYNPQFTVDSAPELPKHLITNGAWSGHRRLAYDLIRFTNPRTVVELGTYYGTSFFSFCQAVKDGGLSTHCFALDTWKGDPHGGYYGEEVYQAVQTVTVREFPQIGTLVRGPFDEAIPLFQDETIDILHIDGYHTYEATLHDYTTWYPKLAKNGVVLFHDIVVRHSNFGVYRLWDELREFPHLEFSHCNGLGALFPKGVSEQFQHVLNQKEQITSHY